MAVPSMSLDQLKRSRTSRRVVIDKLLVELDQAIQSEIVQDVERHLAQLEMKESVLCQVAHQLETLTTDDNELDRAIQDNESYAEKIIDAKILAHRLLTRFQSPGRVTVGNASLSQAPLSANKVVIKLPKLFIKKFDGTIGDWERFFDQFESAVDKNSQLSKVDKFNYLRGFLTENASLTVSGLSLTAANYDIALSLLKKKYGQADVLVAEHVKCLLEVRKISRIDNGQELRALFENFQTHLRALENLGKQVSSMGTLLCPILLKSLPHPLIREWHRKTSGTQNDNLTLLLSFIETEVEGIELACRNSVSLNIQKDSKKKQEDNVTSSSTLVATEKKKFTRSCIFCSSQEHASINCGEFSTVDARREFLKKQGRCLRCLWKSHATSQCDRNFRCRICQNPQHHSLICYRSKGNNNRNVSALSSITKEETHPKVVQTVNTPLQENNAMIASTMSKSVGNTISVLQVLRVWVKHSGGLKQAVLLLDGGSERTFVSQHLVQQLKLPTLSTDSLTVHSFGGKKSTQLSNRIALTIVGNNEMALDITALSVPNRCTGVSIWENSQIEHYLSTHKQKFNWLQAMGLGELVSVDILIGADYYWQILTGHMKRITPFLMATETIFGWTLQGNASAVVESSSAISMFVTSEVVENSTLQCRIEQLWEMDRSGTMALEELSTQTQEDVEVLSQFQRSTTCQNHRYQVDIPWNGEQTQLCNNFFLAKQRLKGLLKQLHKNPPLLERYRAGIYEYLGNGHTEEVDINDHKEPIYFLPHHPIVREDRKTTKLRIVFDGSAHDHTGKSLNQCQFNGPNLNPKIFDLLIRFRWHRVGIIADVEKAFLQINLNPKDRNATRFLWSDSVWSDSEEPELKVFRLTRVLFGMKSSPYLLAATIRHHLKLYENEYPVVSPLLDRSTYVDDVISGADEVNRALFISTRAKELLDLASMPLKKWATNDSSLRQLWRDLGMIPHEEPIELLKVLGLMWDTESDSLSYKTTELFKAINVSLSTKRHILEILARIFDPLGVLSPKLITIKLLLQDLWRLKVSWDEPIPDHLQLIWNKWKEDLQHLKNYQFERWYHTLSSHTSNMQLHLFCDSSMQAYGAVAYLRIVNLELQVKTIIVAAKSRVAPLKLMSIPRLELLACLVGARLAKTLLIAWDLPSMATYYWTDSQVALQWVTSNPTRWKVFVARRVQEIQDLSSASSWRYCMSKDNPADILSRGQTLEKLFENNLWKHGPKWLAEEKNWDKISIEVNETPQELIQAEAVNTFLVTISKRENLFCPKKFSNWKKIIRVTAWVIRFLQNCKKAQIQHKFLTFKELKNAELYWLGQIQSILFFEEKQSLEQKQALKANSSLVPFQPFLDRAGIIRISGRIHHANITRQQAHPILLRGGGLTDLFILDRHEKTLHGGVQATLSKIRETVWLIKGRQAVRKALTSCMVCRKWVAKPITMIEAPLPADRIVRSMPFEVAGIDFCGPIWIKQNKEKKKSYVCLFTCAVTRAVHLELTLSQGTKHFLLALRRFVARRGYIRTIYSDNASTFKQADNLLQDSLSSLQDVDIQEWSEQRGIEWKFIPRRAAWWGGFYERMVGSVKRHLRRTLGACLMNAEELATLLTEIEAIINARPLTTLTEDFQDSEVLSPMHFLIGKEGNSLPDLLLSLNSVPVRPTLLKKWAYRKRLMDNFWRQWSKDYMLQLSTAHLIKVPVNQQTLKKGDIVLLKEDRLPRGRWKMAVVEDTYEGRDGKIRSLLLKTVGGATLRRAVQHVCPLEIA